MIGVMALLVGGVGLMTIPIQREQVERTTRDQMVAGVGLIAELISASLPERLQPGDPLDLSRAAEITGRLDLGQLQELVDRSRSEFIAYVTLSDTEGSVLASDRLSLVGERVPTAAQPELREGEWRNGPIWVVSAPLLRGSNGPQVGTLSIGVSRAPVERFLDESRTLLLLFGLIALLAGVLLAQALGGAVASPVEALAVGTRRVAAGELDVRFAAGGRDELAQLGAAFNQMVAGLRERERLRDLFGKYVSREVREAVLSGRVSLASERRTITCLYCDMRGSTGFAERYQPEEVMAALNAYFAVIIRATEAEGGIVNRFVGDEAVCVFGAPTPYPDHAERGVRAALAIRTGFVELERSRAAHGLPTPQFGIGLNSGLVAAGATGSEERQEYTVIGDAMNVGARIQGLTKQFAAHDVLLSEFTVAALGPQAGHYAPTDLGPVEIRGKQAPVRVYGLSVAPATPREVTHAPEAIQPLYKREEIPDGSPAGEQRP
jgi:class 3 adenylate cyclase